MLSDTMVVYVRRGDISELDAQLTMDSKYCSRSIE